MPIYDLEERTYLFVKNVREIIYKIEKGGIKANKLQPLEI